IIAATNRPDVLDNALLRPGRFDRQVTIDLPDMKGREEVLAVHVKKVPIAADVDLKLLARGTPGFSGADMANLVNEAALMAARKNKRLVSIKDFEAAKDKIIMGTKRSRIMTEDERRTTAYHEAGHTIVSISLPETEPIHKVTITPHGMALGLTVSLPERDFVSESKTKLISRMAILAAGRVAEEILLGPEKITTGAVNDIQRLTKIARAMVMRLGMIEELGIVDYETLSGQSESYNIIKGISDSTAKKIDEYVRRLAEGARSTAWKILEEKRKELDALSNALLEHEVLSGDDVKEIMAGNKPRRRKAPAETPEVKATISVESRPQPAGETTGETASETTGEKAGETADENL
ncbi:MAG: cell division protein FtsH, partial [Alphaproteobacteria bacterium]|nr:cell division protein FtsH [Alphaproteobacteria bacterium]